MMKQKDELAKVKVRIKALSDKTIDNGCSEAEALFAAEKVGQLLETYNLTMDQCDVREEKCVLVKATTGSKQRTSHDLFAFDLARFCDVKCWSNSVSRYNKDGRYSFSFYGLEPDVQMAEYLFKVVSAAIQKAADDAKKDPAYRGRASTFAFKKGMARRVGSRLSVMKAQRDRARQANSTSTALVALKGQLVEEQFREHVGLRLVSRRIDVNVRDWGAYGRGGEAGEKVNLSRPIEGGSAPVAGLLR